MFTLLNFHLAHRGASRSLDSRGRSCGAIVARQRPIELGILSGRTATARIGDGTSSDFFSYGACRTRTAARRGRLKQIRPNNRVSSDRRGLGIQMMSAENEAQRAEVMLFLELDD